MNVSQHRRSVNRCEERLVERGSPAAKQHKMRSWRCQLVNGHEGQHVSYSGHRKWGVRERTV